MWLGGKTLFAAAPGIRKTCPCNVYPLKPHFYIEKLGFAGIYIFSLFLIQNIYCGYSLEPPLRGGSNVYPQSIFLAKMLKYYFFVIKFSIFTAEKSLYIAWASFCNVTKYKHIAFAAVYWKCKKDFAFEKSPSRHAYLWLN